jgi:hypothetical protein
MISSAIDWHCTRSRHKRRSVRRAGVPGFADLGSGETKGGDRGDGPFELTLEGRNGA